MGRAVALIERHSQLKASPQEISLFFLSLLSWEPSQKPNGKRLLKISIPVILPRHRARRRKVGGNPGVANGISLLGLHIDLLPFPLWCHIYPEHSFLFCFFSFSNLGFMLLYYLFICSSFKHGVYRIIV